MLTVITDPIGLYIAVGLLIVNGSMAMSYIVHSMFLPNWFVRNRGLAVGIAFSGVGVGSLVLLPLFQNIIALNGWREACLQMAIIVCVAIIPINVLLQRNAPTDMGLQPDGDAVPAEMGGPAKGAELIRDHAWAGTDWTISNAMFTMRFWALFIAFFGALFVWYGLQAHQTKFLLDKGFSSNFAATALGMAAFFGIFGQIGIGALSDRVGRELAWTISLAGFGAASILMVLIGKSPSTELVYLAMAAQGLFGYGMASLFGAITAEVFAGPKSREHSFRPGARRQHRCRRRRLRTRRGLRYLRQLRSRLLDVLGGFDYVDRVHLDCLAKPHPHRRRRSQAGVTRL